MYRILIAPARLRASRAAEKRWLSQLDQEIKSAIMISYLSSPQLPRAVHSSAQVASNAVAPPCPEVEQNAYGRQGPRQQEQQADESKTTS